MKYLAAAALAAAFVVAPANASDAVTYRVEAHGGWDRITVGGEGANGAFYGVGVGIDVPVSATMFIGFEANADLSSTKDCVTGYLILNDRYCQKAKRDLGANLRVGANVGSGVKVYVLGGYTNTRIEESYTSAFGSFDGASNGNGVRVGAGTEIKMGKLAYAKLEYRYSNYEGGYERHQVVTGLGLGF